MRRRGVLVTAVLVALGSALSPVTEAGAVDPSCGSQQAPSPPIEVLPWAQRMYDPANMIWPFSKGAGITVAVLDSGVDATHPQLQGRVLSGYDFFRNVPDGTVDCVPHGTAVASIIAAQQINGVGFVGLAPAATILPVRVSDKTHASPAEDLLSPAVLAAGIEYAVASGAQVIAVSAITYVDDPGLHAAVDGAVAAGAVVVAAVGDGHDGERDGQGPTLFVSFPAAYDGVIGVGAVGADGMRAQSSQIGSVDLVAPGQEVIAASFGGHSSFNGTGIAVGFVAASAALMLGQAGSDLGGLTGPERVRVLTERLLGSADGTPGGAPSLAYGNGLVDPYRAMSEVTRLGPEAIPGREAPPIDEAARRLAAERAAADASALSSATLLGGLALAVLAAAVFVPQARRRRWRPGRDRELQPAREDTRPEFLPGEMLFQSPADKVSPG